MAWTASGRDDFHHSRPRPADRRAGRLLPGLRPAGASGQGVQRGLRLRRLLQPLPPPPARQPRGRRSTARASSSACRTTTRWATGPRATGSATILPPAAQRLACGLLLLSPCVPLLFMGEEYGETRPFPFFCSFGDPAADRGGAPRAGARSSPRWLSAGQAEIPDPAGPRHVRGGQARAGHWPDGSPQAGCGALPICLAARRRWPALARPAAHVGPAGRLEADAMRRPRRTAGARAPGARSPCSPDLSSAGRGERACWPWPISRPAPQWPRGLGRAARFCSSTEDPRYGGPQRGQPPMQLLPYEL